MIVATLPDPTVLPPSLFYGGENGMVEGNFRRVLWYISLFFSVLICFLRIFRAKIEPEGKHENNCSTYISFTLLTFASSYLILVSNSVISCFCLQSSDSNYCLSEIQFLNSYKKPGKYLFKTSSSIALYWLYLCLYTVLLNILASLF